MRKNRKKGFTLIELLVVLAIVGIMSAFVVPRLTGSLSNMTQKTAARKVCAALRYARSQAVSEGVTLVAFVDKEKRSLVIDNETDSDRTYGESNTDKESSEESRHVYILPDDVNFETIEDSREKWAENVLMISFYPTGRASGGRFRLVRPDKISHIVSVDRVTGAVSIES